jgi:hypothetical protein
MNRAVLSYRDLPFAAAVVFSAAMLVFFGVLTGLCRSFASWADGQDPEPVPLSERCFSTSIIWTELLQKTPYPHTAPLPPRVRTALDGTYAKFDPKKTPPIPCRRCPDYMPEGGIWRLNLDQGVFRIFHEVTDWRSLGSFNIEGNQLRLFNDPYCMEVTGVYRWTLKDKRLVLQVVEDKCAIGLRAKNLAQLPWSSCETLSANGALPNCCCQSPGCE